MAAHFAIGLKTFGDMLQSDPALRETLNKHLLTRGTLSAKQ